MAKGAGDLRMEPDALSPEVQPYLTLLDMPIPKSIFSQDPTSICHAARQLYQARVLEIYADQSVADAPTDPLQDDIPPSLYATVLHQASEMQRQHRPGYIVLPEVINMLVILLRYIYPLHEIRSSVSYAVTMPPQPGEAHVGPLHGKAVLVMRERYWPAGGESPTPPFSDPLTSFSATSIPADLCAADRGPPSRACSDERASEDFQPESYSVEDFACLEDGDTDNYGDSNTTGEFEEHSDFDDCDSYRSGSDRSSVMNTGALHGISLGHDQQLECTGDADPQGPAVVCVDTVEGIATLLESALHHRMALGVAGALVGLVCEKTSTVIRPMVGWLDGHVEEGHNLPTAHVSSLGSCAFDVSDPVDAVKLVLFLLGAKRVPTDPSRHVLPTGLLRWRADLRPRINIWDDISDDPGGCVEGQRCALHSSSSQLMPQNDSKVPSQGQSALTSRTTAGERKRIKTHPRTKPYFYARRVVLRSLKIQIRRDVLPIPDTYVHATALVKFAQDLTFVRYVCPSLGTHEIVGELQGAYNRLVREDGFIGHACPAVEAAIKDAFCSLIDVVKTARTINSNLKPLGAASSGQIEFLQSKDEMTHRHLWDQVIATVVSSCGLKDVDYDRETLIQFPENPLVPLLSRPDSEGAVGNEMITCHDAFNAAYPKPTKAMKDAYQREAYMHWSSAERIVDQIQYDPSYPREELDKEPIRGKADGMVTLSITGAYSSSKVAEAVALWRPRLTLVPERLEDVYSAAPATPRTSRSFTKSSVFVDNTPMYCDAHPLLPTASPTPPAGPDAELAPMGSPTVGPGQADPDVTASTCTAHDQASPRTHTVITADPCAIHFPLLNVEHQTELGPLGEEAVTDQNRLYLTAALCFTRLFGIVRFPMFGFTTSGSHGVISCAWSDKILAVQNSLAAGSPENVGITPQLYHPEVKVIADQHAILLDIRNPLDVLNLATSVAYIALEHAHRARSLFQLTDEAVKKCEVPPALQEYLDSSATVSPMGIARAMTPEDGKWRKKAVPNEKQ
ncbi:hypothetical protein L227DRAFT_611401 [Lentinus tigrinus ALCF2SS1-6]|uniref:Uncharacterized protein n=1 Tax=Lentinus tigrinus ALCF2SS1-6 TaxID=1328759 RepID=A0A5C2S9M3_9APHY|nr:hypothetical protein L227DRAFT_611401 [Lentinus tigrinus ALCF2SS1-6]